jgi:hypothetical protein
MGGTMSQWSSPSVLLDVHGIGHEEAQNAQKFRSETIVSGMESDAQPVCCTDRDAALCNDWVRAALRCDGMRTVFIAA